MRKKKSKSCILCNNIRDMWQSQKSFLPLKTYWGLAGISVVIVLILQYYYRQSEVKIEKALYVYVIGVTLFLVIILLTTSWYIYNKCNLSKNIEEILHIIFCFIACLFFVWCIPLIIVFFLLEKVAEQRAKKIDNLLAANLLIYVDLIIILILHPLTCRLVDQIMNCINSIGNWGGVVINREAMILFCGLSLWVVEVNCFNLIILYFWNKYERYNINKKYKSDYKIYDNQKNPERNELKEDKRQKIYDLKYKLNYLKYTAWSAQLFALIVWFGYEIFIQNDSSNTINVLTMFTLIMLYYDKRKAWDARTD